MATSIALITERCRRVISGGFPKDNDRVKNQELKYHITSVANRLLKVDFFNVTMKEGETIPDGCMIATYEKVPVTKSLGRTSQAKLPVTPMMLPDKMGVFSVYPSGYPELEFIPIPSGVANIFKKDKLVNPIHRKLYWYDSGKVTIDDDLIAAGITSVDIKLAVFDFTHYTDDENIPITPELEDQIIREVCAMYLAEPDKPRAE